MVITNVHLVLAYFNITSVIEHGTVRQTLLTLYLPICYNSKKCFNNIFTCILSRFFKDCIVCEAFKDSCYYPFCKVFERKEAYTTFDVFVSEAYRVLGISPL